ncbi:MAG: AAA family ATPase [Aquihabitans sp.]
MDELENPYRPGAGTSPPALLGRDALINDFGVALRRALNAQPGKAIMAIGLRGVGKTVLLNRFVEIAEDEGVAVGFIEAPETGGFSRQLAARLRAILLALDSQRRTTKVLRALRILKTFTLQLPDGSRLALDVDAMAGVADSGNLSDDLTDLLVAAGEAAEEHGTGLLIAVDELQYLNAEELGALISAIHRTTQRDLPVVVVGAGLPQLPGLAGEAKSYAERLFEFPEIGPLALDDARAALIVPAQERGVELAGEAVDAIIERAQGYPYFLQEWGYHVWNAADSSPVSRAVVDEVSESVIERLDRNFFRVRFDRLTPIEKTYLRAMAELGPGPHRSGDIAAEAGAKVASVAPRRAALIAKGMLYSPAYGETAFTVPLFDDFLRRTLPEG